MGYDSGSMREIVEENFGKLVKIDQNFNIDRNEVIKKIEIINDNYNSMNQSLKNLNKKFSLDFMTNEYVNEISKT